MQAQNLTRSNTGLQTRLALANIREEIELTSRTAARLAILSQRKSARNSSKSRPLAAQDAVWLAKVSYRDTVEGFSEEKTVKFTRITVDPKQMGPGGALRQRMRILWQPLWEWSLIK